MISLHNHTWRAKTCNSITITLQALVPNSISWWKALIELKNKPMITKQMTWLKTIEKCQSWNSSNKVSTKVVCQEFRKWAHNQQHVHNEAAKMRTMYPTYHCSIKDQSLLKHLRSWQGEIGQISASRWEHQLKRSV